VPGATERVGGSTAIRVENLSKTFDTAAVLHDFSLDVRAGELLALLGPSGSGKTTLLRIIAGLDFPDDGRIVFGAEDATKLPVQQRAVGFVFQHYALFKHMSVADNIAYGLNARKRADRPAKAEIKKRVGDLLDLIKLSGFADRYPSQLSGGQRQRIALAFCWTSPSGRWTPRSAGTCAAGCARSTTAPARPRSSSPTTRTRPSSSPTASPCSPRAASNRSAPRTRCRRPRSPPPC
jgi:ABC-type uncharacterized transport system YnjBCD ATPase subunit